jgi:uncharacterized protein YndB with AHSA1/START domain
MSDLGTVTIKGDTTVLRYERRYRHSIERVWSAITSPDELFRWWGKVDIDLVEGGKVVVAWQNSDVDGEQAIMHAVITALDPPRLLELEGDIHGVLRFELRPDGDGCALTFSSTVKLPGEQHTEVAAGWHWHLDALDDALDGASVDWPNWDDRKPEWELLERQYATTL